MASGLVTTAGAAATSTRGKMVGAEVPVVALGVRGLRFAFADRGRKRRIGKAAAPDSWAVNVEALDLRPGEQMLLTGGTGTGKSTLIQLIAGLIDPDEGRVFVAGTDIHGSWRGAQRDRFRAGHIGIIARKFRLLAEFSALENVMAALMFQSAIPRREHVRRAEGMLRELGVAEVTAPCRCLSEAQRCRVALARAVICAPALILADEPTAGLDGEHAAIAMDLMQSTCRSRKAALLCVNRPDPEIEERFGIVMRLEDLAADSAV